MICPCCRGTGVVDSVPAELPGRALIRIPVGRGVSMTVSVHGGEPDARQIDVLMKMLPLIREGLSDEVAP